MAKDDDVVEGAHRLTQFGERLLEAAENLIYTAVAVLLVVAAVILLGGSSKELFKLPEEDSSIVVLSLLDQLLLVFVLLELLFAVRMTLVRREIVAEPFLIVGIIASIKEIILLSVEVANVLEGKPTAGDPIQDTTRFVVAIAVLGVLVVLLAGAAVLLRVKERSPSEGKRNEEELEEGELKPKEPRPQGDSESDDDSEGDDDSKGKGLFGRKG